MGRKLNGRTSGTVEDFFADKGFGFIAPDSGGRDVFVHKTSIITSGRQELDKGERVHFEVQIDSVNGRLRAEKVKRENETSTEPRTGDDWTIASGNRHGRKSHECCMAAADSHESGKKTRRGIWRRQRGWPGRKGVHHPPQHCNWASIPTDILCQITQYISDPPDLGSMRLTCKHWRNSANLSITQLCYPAPTPTIPTSFPLLTSLDFSQRQPWAVGCTGSSKLQNELLLCGVKSLTKLGKLKRLDFSGWVELGDGWLEVVKNLSGISRLDLARCSEVTDWGWQAIGKMTGLKELDLQGCWRLQSMRCSTLVNLTQLRLSGCSGINDAGLHSLTTLVRLHTLDLSGCSLISGRGIQYLSDLRNLQKMEMGDLQHLIDSDAWGLACINSLTSLKLGDWALSDAGLDALSGLTALKELDLVTVPVFGIGLSGLTSLTTLRCENCYQFDDNSPFFIAQLSRLERLLLPSCTEIGPEGVPNLVLLTNLLELDLSDIPDLDDECIEDLSGLTNLTCLNLSGTHWGGFTEFTDNAVLALHAFPRLAVLKISRWALLSDIGLSALQILTDLRDLDLSWCKGITMEGAQSLTRLSKLTALDISWCLGLDSKKVSKLLPKVEITT